MYPYYPHTIYNTQTHGHTDTHTRTHAHTHAHTHEGGWATLKQNSYPIRKISICVPSRRNFDRFVKIHQNRQRKTDDYRMSKTLEDGLWLPKVAGEFKTVEYTIGRPKKTGLLSP